MLRLRRRPAFRVMVQSDTGDVSKAKGSISYNLSKTAQIGTLLLQPGNIWAGAIVSHPPLFGTKMTKVGALEHKIREVSNSAQI